MVAKKPTSEELRQEVLELRTLVDRLRKRAEELAIRSEELEKTIRPTKHRSIETKGR
jgi:uncharacterized protein YlxW (UPF0749 family)